MSLINLSPAQLRHAADIKEKIESLQHELSHLQGAPAAAAPAAEAPTAEPAKRAKRTISAAGIARIKAAQKLRWAKVKGTAAAKPAKAAKPGKRGPRKMSAAARAKIGAAQKIRWAKFHAEKGGK
jgi:hypothetical protein